MFKNAFTLVVLSAAAVLMTAAVAKSNNAINANFEQCNLQCGHQAAAALATPGERILRRGKAGPRGEPGGQGPIGKTGPKGPAGPAGPTGPAGATGPTGAAGVPGAQGQTGSAGIKGEKGETGSIDALQKQLDDIKGKVHCKFEPHVVACEFFY